MTITPVEGHGFFYNDEFYDVGQYGPGEQPEEPPFREVLPWLHPFNENTFWNTPVGADATYLSTSSAQHQNLTQNNNSNIGLNYNNWSDPFYLATDSDPLMEVEQRSVLPTNWQNVGSGQTGGTSGQGVLQQRYTGIRIPTNANWQSTSNTDRKVIVVQPEVTFQRYNASNQLISTQVFPAGTLSIEMHKFYRVTGGEKILTTNMSWCDMRGYGMGYGAFAGGVSMSQGYIRRWEWDAAAAGDHTAIRHALKIGLPASKLKSGQIWPASHQDGSANDDPPRGYHGENPMGTFFVLNKATNIDSLSLAPTTKAIAWTLQNFGAYVLIQAGTGPINFGIESTPPHLSSGVIETTRNQIKDVLLPHFRIVANSNDVGPLHSGGDLNRHPIDQSRIAGGGARNESLRPLPINPEGPWV